MILIGSNLAAHCERSKQPPDTGCMLVLTLVVKNSKFLHHLLGLSPNNMELQDGRDPFDRQSYYSETGLTIATMTKLRAFCTSFFDRSVRHKTDPTNEEMISKFIKLITHSDFFFARARAVIPELQVPNTVISHENIDICRILIETQKFRGSPGKKWSITPDESAWSKLSEDGRAMLERQSKEHKEQLGDASAQSLTSSKSS